MAIEDTSRVDELLQVLSELSSKYVEIGILSDSASSQVMMIATVHEFGVQIKVTDKMRGYFLYNFGIPLKTDVINIPERSFIRSSFDKYQGEIAKLGDYLDQVLHLELSVSAFYTLVGERCVAMIKEYITSMTSPPLSNLTIENKGSSGLLRDTGQLVSSITYKVRG